MKMSISGNFCRKKYTDTRFPKRSPVAYQGGFFEKKPRGLPRGVPKSPWPRGVLERSPVAFPGGFWKEAPWPSQGIKYTHVEWPLESLHTPVEHMSKVYFVYFDIIAQELVAIRAMRLVYQ
jgi:hypothetical protein